MEIITSTDNPNIKLIKKLGQKKSRVKEGLFVVENPLIVQDAARMGVFPEKLFVAPEYEEKNNELLFDLVSEMGKNNIIRVDSKVLKQVSSLESSQGVIALYALPEGKIDYSKSIVFLDGVSDAGNAGTIIRLASAYKIGTVVFDEEAVDPFNAKTIGAAKEAIFNVGLIKTTQFELVEIRKHMPIFALDVKAEDSLSKTEFPSRFCLLLGSEAHGISSSLRQNIDSTVRIEMGENTVESLNVGTAAAIALHHYFVQSS